MVGMAAAYMGTHVYGIDANNSDNNAGPAIAEPPEYALGGNDPTIPGYCQQPVPESSLPGHVTVTCYSPGIPLAPGQVRQPTCYISSTTTLDICEGCIQ